MFDTNFSNLDLSIVVVYLSFTVFIGIYVNRHIHNSAGYLVGGRATGTALNIATLIGTELGLVTVMYAAADGFQGGFAYFMTPLIWGVVTLLIGVTGFGVVRMRRLKLTTIPEYFQRRYSRRVRITAGTMCFIAGVLNMSIFPKMGATFITFATGNGDVEDVESIIKIITTVLIVLVLIYTMLGGMVAVIVTDYMQFVVLGLGLVLGLFFCFSLPELGWSQVVNNWHASKGDAAFDPLTSSRYGLPYLILQAVVAVYATICWSPNATRCLTTDSEETTRRTYLFASAGLFARFAIPGLWGVLAFSYLTLPGGPDGLAEFFSLEAIAEDGSRAAQGMPLLLGKISPSGFLGIIMAGLMAAFMSTHDSYLLSWASIASQDIVAPLLGRELTNRQSIWCTRAFIMIIGVFLVIVGIWFSLPDDIWPYLFVTGSIFLNGAAPALLGGMYWRRASSTGALIGLLSGFGAIAALYDKALQRQVAAWCGFVDAQGVTDATQVTAYVNQATITLASCVFSIVLFVAGSLLFPDAESKFDSSGVSET